MSSPFTRSLKLRTVSLALVAGLVPLALVGAAAWSTLEDELVRGVLVHHQALTRQVLAGLEAELCAHRRGLEGLAQRTDVQSLDPARARPALQEHLATQSVFHALALHDRAGRPLTWTGAAPFEIASKDFESWTHARAADCPGTAAGRTFAHGTIQLSYALPVPDFSGTGVAGLLTGSLRLHGAGLQKVLESQAPGDDTSVFVLDGEGRTLAAVGPGRAGRVYRMRVAGGAGTGRAGLLGAEQLVAIVHQDELGVDVVVAEPYARVTAALVSAAGSLSAYVAIGVLLAALLGVWLASTLVRPTIALTDAIQRVARGDLSHRVPVDRADELGQAASAFNDLAASLHRVRLLEESWRLRRAGKKP